MTNRDAKKPKSGLPALSTARQWAGDAREAIVSGRYRQAVELADRGLAVLEPISTTPDGEKARFDLLIERGRARTLLGDYAAASDFQLVRADSQEPIQRTQALIGMADCHVGIGDYEAAGSGYQLALEESHAANCDLCLARSWVGLGTLYWKQGRIDEAVQVLLQARTVLQRSPNLYEMGRVLLSLGISHQFAGRLDQAIDTHREALKCFRTMGDNHRVAAVLNNLGELHQELWSLDQALRYHEEAVIIAVEANAQRMEVDITRNIGVDLLLMSRYSEAMIALNQALSNAREMGDKDLILQALYSLGDAFLRQGEVNRAQQVTTELAAEARAVRSELHTARAKHLQGRIHLARGERSAAQAVLQDALGEAHSLPSRLLLWQLHATLGRATEDPQVSSIHFRIAADFIKQTVEPLTDPELRSRFLEQAEVRTVLERAK